MIRANPGLPFSSLESLSRKTGDSGESGKDDGQMVDDRDTRLPLLLSPVSRISQWSDIDELVEPVRHTKEREGSEEEYEP